MKHFVYITKIVTYDEIFFYAGKHSTTNINDGYVGSGKTLRVMMENDSNIQIEVIERCFVDSEDQAFELEEIVIDCLKNKLEERCINISDGSKGWFLKYANEEKLNEWKRKLSIAQTGKKLSNDTRNKIRMVHLGRKQTKEHIKKRFLDRTNAHSSETKSKMSSSSAWKNELPWIRSIRLHPNSETSEVWYHLEELYKIYKNASLKSLVTARILKKLALSNHIPISSKSRLEAVVRWFEKGNNPKDFIDQLPRR